MGPSGRSHPARREIPIRVRRRPFVSFWCVRFESVPDCQSWIVAAATAGGISASLKMLFGVSVVRNGQFMPNRIRTGDSRPNVCFGSKADMSFATEDVRFKTQRSSCARAAGCPLSACSASKGREAARRSGPRSRKTGSNTTGTICFGSSAGQVTLA